jgi:hypothetical protein
MANNGEKLFVFDGSGNKGFARDIFIGDPNTRKIERLSDTFAATVLNNITYVIGVTKEPNGPFLYTIQTFLIE